MFKRVLFMFVFFLLASAFGVIAQADYSTAHIWKGNFKQSGTGLYYYPDSSVSAYGYTGAVDNAASKWSSASSKVNLSKVSSDPGVGTVAVFVTFYELPPDYYGDCGFWVRGLTGWQSVSWTKVRDGSNFDRARVRVDHGWLSDDGSSQNKRWHTVGHEFGHALSLDHFYNSPSHSGHHWMSFGELTSPSSQDRDHLQQKWGV